MILTPHHAGQVTIIGSHRTIEADTYTCVHCNNVRYYRSNDPAIVADPGGMCTKCMDRICSICVGKECLTFEEKLDIYERRQGLFKAMGLKL